MIIKQKNMSVQEENTEIPIWGNISDYNGFIYQLRGTSFVLINALITNKQIHI